MHIKSIAPRFKELGRIAFFIACGVFLIFAVARPRVSIETHAERIIRTCASDSFRERCYDKEIPALAKVLSMEKVFEVIKLIQKSDSVYWFCHLGAHAVSTEEYKKTKDWKEVVARCPVGICSNGCIHGAIQEHFTSESLAGAQLEEVKPTLKTLCEKRSGWDPTRQQQSSCYHEIGHISMYLTRGNMERSAELCNEIAIKEDGRDYTQTCYEGITMQVFQPLGGDDFALIYPLIPKKDAIKNCESYEGEEKAICWRKGWEGRVPEFCGRFTNELRNACFREAWVTAGRALETPLGITEYCSYAEDSLESKRCYNKLFYGLLSRFKFDEMRMEALCITLPSGIQGQCFANTASRLIETDQTLTERSLHVCEKASSLGLERECYEELAYYAGFIFPEESKEAQLFCARFPEAWGNECKSRISR